MTILIGLEHNGAVYLGADSIATDGYDRSITLIPKVFHHPDGYLVGYTGSFRLGQILRYHLSCPAPLGLADKTGWAVQQFTEALRQTLKAHGFVEEDGEDVGRWRVMLGLKDTLFTVQSDFQVSRYACKFATAGSAEQFARGAMLALADVPARLRIQRALEIASELSVYAAAPFVIRSTMDTT